MSTECYQVKLASETVLFLIHYCTLTPAVLYPLDATELVPDSLIR